MKKGLALMMWLMTVIFLSACGDKHDNDTHVDDVTENVNIDENVENSDLDIDKYARTELTIEDLDEIDQILFPSSYAYEIYRVDDGSVVESWEYVYPEDIDHSLLLPIHATMANREVIDSYMQDELIYTSVSVELQDGERYTVLYINDPVTLEYLAASVDGWEEASLYTFYY